MAWLTFAPDALAQISVNFQANASVAEARIVLADIAVIKPAGSAADTIGKLPVAAAPAPGKTKQLSTVSVISSLRNRPEVAEVDWQGSPTITVERKGNHISQEQIQQIVAAYLQENSAKLKSEVQFTATRTPEQLILPTGQLRWKVTPSNPDILGSSSFSIFFTVDGKPAGNCVVRGKLDSFAEILTAARTLHKGDVIKEEHLALKRQSLAGLEDPFIHPEQIVDMQLARTVNAGKPLTLKDIIAPALIKNGEMVKIYARKGSLELSTGGIAQADGRLGETIKVKNISSSKLVHCRVDGPGIVSVNF
jgi:flagella basal body P-ring formation protein FlgA